MLSDLTAGSKVSVSQNPCFLLILPDLVGLLVVIIDVAAELLIAEEVRHWDEVVKTIMEFPRELVVDIAKEEG